MKYLRVLRDNPDFARLWMANVVSLMGDWFNTIVLYSLVQRYSPGREGIAIGTIVLARMLPPMLLSPTAGSLIDRFNRKWLLIWSNLLRGVVVIGFLFTLDNPDLLWLVYLLTVVQFILASVFEPGQAALISNVVKSDDLVAANTLFSITWSAMLAFGAAAGGIVANFLGAATALIFDAITFVIGAALLWQIKGYKFLPIVHTETPPDTSIRDGLRYVGKRPALASLLMIKFGSSIGNVDTLMAIYATQIFVLGTEGQLSLGIMYSVFGIGAVLGPVLLNRFNDESIPRMRYLITIGFIWTVIAWAIMGGAGVLWIFCLGLLLRAMGGSSNWTYSTILIQKTAEDRYLGRVFSLDMMAFYAAGIGSTIIHGTVIDLVGTANAHWVAYGTGIVALLPLAAWVWINRRLKAQAPVPVPGD